MPKPDDQTKAADQAVPDNVVVLDEPIKRGDTTITQLELRKPMSGELRGVSLSDLLNLDVNALRKVLPRITTPTLTDIEVGRMDPADLLDAGAKVAGFLLKKSAKAEAFLSA
ncbi:phage tail assembly protein [Pseudomonas spirodelae]|uniref:Phage tail assembly protein n=1 Tax=Pseudomonas spirodelae TaxID=3101751 RepID=A0ABU5P907_9PSED|nr:phage tail assembly protein [Pseudomonas sp. T5W1]MEA1606144.1 phage tail assembly protein [Pseudomonas sp. T5W1]